MQYKIVRCPNCATWQMTTSKKTLKCIKCGKTKVLTSLKIFYHSENPQMTTKVLQELKLEKPIKDNKYSEEFESAI